MAEQKTTMRSLDRAMRVLEVLELEGRMLRLTEVAQKTGLHLATTQRILATLEAHGRVERSAAGYRPGVAQVLGAHAFLAANPLVLAARPVLHELSAHTGLTSSLYMRTGWNRVIVARVEGSRPLRYQLPFGRRLPLHLGGGKVFAAELSKEELARFMTEAGPLTDREGAPLDRGAFTEELRDVRRRGHHVSFGERQEGVISITVPVRDADREVVGAIALSAAADDLPHEGIDPLLTQLRQAAQGVGEHLASQG
jgi:DNA-binding IclR family transcriptional regulator